LPPGGTLSLSPKAVSFPATGTGTTAKPRGIQISNSGSGTLTVVINATSLVLPFGLAPNTPTSFTLAHGKGKSIGITFMPTAVGTPSASLEILTGDPNHAMTTVTVGGTARPPVLTGPTKPINFGKVKDGGSKTLSFTIKDAGLGVLNGTIDTSALGAGFKMASSTAPFTLKSQKTMKIKVTFNPNAKTPFSGTLGITSNGGNLSITLSGTGI
jgi:hypothetical protein